MYAVGKPVNDSRVTASIRIAINDPSASHVRGPEALVAAIAAP